jgi:hypothetical protein
MVSFVWLSTARCGRDGDDQAGGLARRTRWAAAQRRTGWDGYLFRDAKAP